MNEESDNVTKPRDLYKKTKKTKGTSVQSSAFAHFCVYVASTHRTCYVQSASTHKKKRDEGERPLKKRKGTSVQSASTHGTFL